MRFVTRRRMGCGGSKSVVSDTGRASTRHIRSQCIADYLVRIRFPAKQLAGAAQVYSALKQYVDSHHELKVHPLDSRP